MDRLPELPAMMDNASKALELLAAGTVASNNEIAKKFEYEKIKLKINKTILLFLCYCNNIIANNIKLIRL